MSKIIFKLKPVYFASVGFFAAVGVLSFSHVGPAQAQSPGVNLAQIVVQVNTLQSTVASQGKTISALQTNLATETTRAMGAEAALQTRDTALETKTAPLSLSRSSTGRAVRRPAMVLATSLSATTKKTPSTPKTVPAAMTSSSAWATTTSPTAVWWQEKATT